MSKIDSDTKVNVFVVGVVITKDTINNEIVGWEKVAKLMHFIVSNKKTIGDIVCLVENDLGDEDKALIFTLSKAFARKYDHSMTLKKYDEEISDDETVYRAEFRKHYKNVVVIPCVFVKNRMQFKK